MGETTEIGWTDHTFNPWMGCTKVSAACDHCYAEALGKRTGRVQWGDDAERVVTSDAYWWNPLRWNEKASLECRRHRVFCASLADVFEAPPNIDTFITIDAARRRLWALVEMTPWLDWQLLTKRPENVTGLVWCRWLEEQWPANCWIGTTVEDQERADERIPHLLGIPAPVRFLSCEPLLGRLDLTHWLRPKPAIDWVIVGGESGPGHRPLDLVAARDLRDQCLQYGVPFFFKQVGGRTPKAGGDELDGRTWKQFPGLETAA